MILNLRIHGLAEGKDADRLEQLPSGPDPAGTLSGMPALRDDPRVPPETIVDNMMFARRTSKAGPLCRMVCCYSNPD
jgi:hypothetical protein